MNEKDFFFSTLICNTKKELENNLALSSKNYPQQKCCLNIFPRSTAKICNQYVTSNGSVNNHLNKNCVYDIPHCSKLQPNKSYNPNYLKNIDQETELFGITNKDKCKDLKMSVYGNNNLLQDQFDNNFMNYSNTPKIHSFGEEVNRHTVCLNTNNYQNNRVKNSNHIELKDKINNNVCDTNTLIMGRLPRYHTSENIWSNNTKRKLNTQSYLQ